jgi:hypothetical protein
MSIASAAVRHGSLLGAGASVNVSVGWIPKRVDVFNVTDGTKAAIGFPGKLIAFNTGVTAVPLGTDGVTVLPGLKIKGATSGAIAKVKEFVLVSGTFAGGDAAGFFVCDADEITGTFGTENYGFSTSAAAVVDGAVVAAIEDAIYQSAALGFVVGTGVTGITSYVGDATHAKGFTIGSTIAVAAKRLRWTAYRH